METGKTTKGLTPEQVIELRNKKAADMKKEEIKEYTEAMTIRDRLERKLQTDIVTVELTDDLGPFKLTFRKLTPLEHDEIARIQAELLTLPKDKQAEKTDGLYQILGAASQDNLDAVFWKEGKGYSPDVFVSTILTVLAASTMPDEETIRKIKSFRLV